MWQTVCWRAQILLKESQKQMLHCLGASVKKDTCDVVRARDRGNSPSSGEDRVGQGSPLKSERRIRRVKRGQNRVPTVRALLCYRVLTNFVRIINLI